MGWSSPAPPDPAQINGLEGAWHARQGDYAKAEILFRETLEAQEKRLGSGHPTATMIRVRLAAILSRNGKCAEAVPGATAARIAQELRPESVARTPDPYLILARCALERNDGVAGKEFLASARGVIEEMELSDLDPRHHEYQELWSRL